jgi:hypothetical protein
VEPDCGLQANDAIGYARAREHYLALKACGEIFTGIKSPVDLQKESTLQGSAQRFWMYPRPIQILRAQNSPFVDNQKQAVLHRHPHLRHVSNGSNVAAIFSASIP